MLDISWAELMLIGVVALIVIGPKELPGVLRMVGQWVGKIRRMAAEFQSQFQEAMREAEMADLRKQVDELNDTARGLTRHFDPLTLDSSSTASSKPADMTTHSPAPPAVTPEDVTGAAPSAEPPSAQSSLPLPEPVQPVAEKDLASAAPTVSSPVPAPQEAEGGPRA
jgi:sec-independent protein translocase protein TatB